eukprot:COSAG04_NODE_7792_length_1066_cov_1.421923_1_plen_160_part_10
MSGCDKPLKGSSFIALPEPLALKKAVVNVKNDDELCFRWAVLSALFPAGKDAQRVGKYKQHMEKLDWGGLPPGPVALDKIPLADTGDRSQRRGAAHQAPLLPRHIRVPRVAGHVPAQLRVDARLQLDETFDGPPLPLLLPSGSLVPGLISGAGCTACDPS